MVCTSGGRGDIYDAASGKLLQKLWTLDDVANERHHRATLAVFSPDSQTVVLTTFAWLPMIWKDDWTGACTEAESAKGPAEKRQVELDERRLDKFMVRLRGGKGRPSLQLRAGVGGWQVNAPLGMCVPRSPLLTPPPFLFSPGLHRPHLQPLRHQRLPLHHAHLRALLGGQGLPRARQRRRALPPAGRPPRVAGQGDLSL